MESKQNRLFRINWLLENDIDYPAALFFFLFLLNRLTELCGVVLNFCWKKLATARKTVL